MTEGPKRREVTGGIAQGTGIGPYLWNIVYDEALRIGLPEWAEPVWFVDYMAVVVRARTLE